MEEVEKEIPEFRVVGNVTGRRRKALLRPVPNLRDFRGARPDARGAASSRLVRRFCVARRESDSSRWNSRACRIIASKSMGAAMAAMRDRAGVRHPRNRRQTATIGLSRNSFGALARWRRTQRLPRLVGPGPCQEMIFSGLPYNRPWRAADRSGQQSGSCCRSLIPV